MRTGLILFLKWMSTTSLNDFLPDDITMVSSSFVTQLEVFKFQYRFSQHSWILAEIDIISYLNFSWLALP